MPYIEQKIRPAINNFMTDLLKYADILYPGEQNYVHTQILFKGLSKNPSYADLEAAMGRMVLVMLEFWRRVVVPYEERKIKENGDVFAVDAQEPPIAERVKFWEDTLSPNPVGFRGGEERYAFMTGGDPNEHPHA